VAVECGLDLLLVELIEIEAAATAWRRGRCTPGRCGRRAAAASAVATRVLFVLVDHQLADLVAEAQARLVAGHAARRRWCSLGLVLRHGLLDCGLLQLAELRKDLHLRGEANFLLDPLG